MHKIFNQKTKNMIYFISGHRKVTEDEFNAHYIPKLNEALRDPNHSFVVGDYYGVDAMAQQYLIGKTKYVTVYHMFEKPRNNNGNWPTKGGFMSDIERDSAMTISSDIDIAWVREWGAKTGTEQNIVRRKIFGDDMKEQILLLIREAESIINNADLLSDPLHLMEKQFIEVVDKLKVMGYGRMMQMISAIWYKENQSGAMISGPCVVTMQHFFGDDNKGI